MIGPGIRENALREIQRLSVMLLLLVEGCEFERLEFGTLRRGTQKSFIQWNGIVDAIFFRVKLRQVLDWLQHF